MFTQEEYGKIATALNAKILELQKVIEETNDIEIYNEYTEKLTDIKYLQSKAFNIFRFGEPSKTKRKK